MAVKKVITVFGATGAQGGAVARTLLRDEQFEIRAVTRDPSASKAQALAEAGAALVRADLNDEASLPEALAGSHGVFAVTNYWDPSNGAKERQQAERLAELSIDAGVQVFIWASLPNTSKISKPAEHFTGKAEAWEKIKTLGFPYVSAVEAPAYFQNLEATWVQHMGFSKNTDGTASFCFPFLDADDRVPFFDVSEIGLPVLAILKSPDRYNGKRVVFSSPGFNLPISAYQDIFKQVTGLPTGHNPFTYDEVVSFSKDFADVCLYIKEFGYWSGGDDEIDATQVTDQPFTTFEQWLRSSTIPAQFT